MTMPKPSRPTVITFMTLLFIFPASATTLMTPLGTVKYDPWIYVDMHGNIVPIHKSIYVNATMPIKEIYITCNNNIYLPTRVKNDTFAFDILLNTKVCRISAILSDGRIINEDLNFIPASPSVTISQISIVPKPRLTFVYSFPLSGDYLLQVTTPYGTMSKTIKITGSYTNKLDVTLPWSFHRIIDLCTQSLIASRSTRSLVIPTALKLYFNSRLIYSVTTNLTITCDVPYIRVLTTTLSNGENRFCVEVINPLDVPIRNVSIQIGIPFSGYLSLHRSYVSANSNVTICKMISIVAPNVASSSNTSQQMIFSKLIIGNGVFSYTISDKDKFFVPFSVPLLILNTMWPSISLVMVDPPVPSSNGIFRLIIYISNPSPFPFYNVKLLVSPTDGTIVAPLQTPVVMIPKLDGGSTIVRTLVFKLVACKGDVMQLKVTLEAHTPYSSRITAYRFVFPARCTGSIIQSGDVSSGTESRPQNKSMLDKLLHLVFSNPSIGLLSMIAALLILLLAYQVLRAR